MAYRYLDPLDYLKFEVDTHQDYYTNNNLINIYVNRGELTKELIDKYISQGILENKEYSFTN